MTFSEEQIDECPWSVDWDASAGSVILYVTWPRGRALAPFLIQLAFQHDLVRYNPQRDEVYLPPSLATP
jgi:hypothetical protein